MSPTRLLAFFGDELCNASYALQNFVGSDCTSRLLPLDHSGYMLAKGIGANLVSQESFVSSSVYPALVDEAYDITSSWLSGLVCKDEVQRIIDIDSEAWFEFWLEFVYVRRLCAEILRQGYTLVRPRVNRTLSPSIGNCESNIAAYFLDSFWNCEWLVQRKIAQVNYDAMMQKIRNYSRCILSEFRSFFRSRVTSPRNENDSEPTDVLFVFQQNELHRMSPRIDELSANGWNVRCEIVDFACGPSDASGIFSECFRAATERMRNVFAENSLELPCEMQEQLRFYAFERWPALLTQSEVWEGFYKKHRPKVVVTTALHNAESQLPALVARGHGIPSVSLPHGALQVAFKNLSVDVNLVPNLLQESAWRRRLELGSVKTICARNTITEEEYATDASCRSKASPHDGQKGLSILVLLNPVSSRRGRLLPGVSWEMQLKALEDIGWISRVLGDQIDVSFKLHPTDDFSGELISHVLEDRAFEILPLAYPLASALEDSELVIGLNYLGSAILHVLNAKKALINYWKDVNAVTCRFPNSTCDWASVFSVLSHRGELMEILRDCLASSARISDVALKNGQLKEWLASCDEVPGFVSLVEEIMLSSTVRHDIKKCP